MPRLGAGRAAQLEIEELFKLRDVVFVPQPMRGTHLERMIVEEIQQAAEARRHALERRRNFG